MTRSRTMDGWDRSSTNPRNDPPPSSFEMGWMWGKMSAQMDALLPKLEAIETGVERMPERLALRLLEQQKQGRSWNEKFQIVRIVVPSMLITLLVSVRILAPDAFLDLIRLLPHVPR